MSKLFGCLINDPHLVAHVLLPFQPILYVSEAESPYGWGVAHHVHHEVLKKDVFTKRRPRQIGELDFYKLLRDVNAHAIVGQIRKLGLGSAIPENTQPFTYRSWSCGHTGYVERFEIRRRDCLVVATARIETEFELTDLEIVYDASGKPLRVWRRNTFAVTPDADGNPDIALYELRGAIPTLIHRKPNGSVEYQTLAGGRPTAVISLSRSLLTPWIQSSDLEVGESVHDTVIDLDTPFELIPAGTNHGMTEAMKHGPGGLVAPQSQHTL